MQHRPPRFVPTVGGALAAGLVASAMGVAPAVAAGLGAGDASAILGRSLDYAISLRLDPGEVLSTECVSAEVQFGERRVPPPLVRVVIEPTSAETARLRVQTQPVVDEPVLSLTVSAGCSNRITRRYVVLADPPGLRLAAAVTTPPQALQPAAVPAALPAASPASAPLPMSSAPVPVGTPAPAASPSAVQPPPPTPEQIAEQQRRQAEARAERAARLARQRAARERAAREREARAAREAELAAAQAPSGPRLTLDPVETLPARSAAPSRAEHDAVAEALAAVASAASAARQAAEAASAQTARIASLEQELAQLRREAEAQRDLASALRLRLAEAEQGNSWTTPLALLSLLLAVLAAWLAWRLGRAQAVQRAQWQQAAAVPKPGPMTSVSAMGLDDPASLSREPTSPAPFVSNVSNAGRRTTEDVPRTVATPVPAAAVARARGGPAWPPPAPPVAWPPPVSTLPPELPTEEHTPTQTQPIIRPDATTVIEPAMQRTEALPAGGRNVETAPRDVSIEELIDLEQQAEFFMVLGQDEAAVDLLVEHLRSTGGGSPLPYLKLLEIHQRRGDHEAYERMRQRFNHRFNAYAPEWGVDLTSGRTLEDYAGVVPRLQQVWPRPLDAMAELEALLFRKSRGELFDLPAYREVLFLYALARDLLDRAAVDTGSVDLLLPMNDGTEFGSTQPASYLGLDHDAFKDTMPPDDARPTAPLDFDLTSGDRPTSIFDLLDDKPPRKK